MCCIIQLRPPVILVIQDLAMMICCPEDRGTEVRLTSGINIAPIEQATIPAITYKFGQIGAKRNVVDPVWFRALNRLCFGTGIDFEQIRPLLGHEFYVWTQRRQCFFKAVTASVLVASSTSMAVCM